jgi:hypothetical protein
MDPVPLERPGGRSTWAGRFGWYLFGTMAVCAGAAVVGEAFFPAVLPGDSSENELAGLAAAVWALGALISCVFAALAYEAHLRARRRQTDRD